MHVVALIHATARAVDRRKDMAAVRSRSCGDDDGRGDGAHDGGGARPMSCRFAEAAIAGLVQDRYEYQSDYAAASESAYVVAVAVVVASYNASAAAAVGVAAAACAIGIPLLAPLFRSPLSRVHPARTLAHWDARFLSLASSHLLLPHAA